MQHDRHPTGRPGLDCSLETRQVTNLGVTDDDAGDGKVCHDRAMINGEGGDPLGIFLRISKLRESVEISRLFYRPGRHLSAECCRIPCHC